ncbi:MAG TPA: hypothetical protein VFD81_10435 [Methylomirabilota bacterium]|nr:hypothetical protein [Methylomirabilota bacterium]
MAIDVLINLALAGITPGPLVLPHELLDADTITASTRERLIAVWCEADSRTPLYDRIVASRPRARELKRPLAIYTGTFGWALGVTGVVDQHTDQFWMHCRRDGRPLHELREAYELELQLVPVSHVVLVIEPLDVEEGPDELAHLRTCRDLARRHAEIIGVVWLGSLTVEDLPGPPPVVELAPPLQWGGASS